MVRAAAYVALAEMRAITHAEGKPFSYPKLRAGVLARAVPTSARVPTMAHARRRSPSSPRRCHETPLKHRPSEHPQNAQTSAKPRSC
jgi:hypothetical protein